MTDKTPYRAIRNSAAKSHEDLAVQRTVALTRQAQVSDETWETCDQCNGAGGDNQHSVCGKCGGRGGYATDAEWLRQVARGENALVRVHGAAAAANLERIANRLSATNSEAVSELVEPGLAAVDAEATRIQEAVFSDVGSGGREATLRIATELVCARHAAKLGSRAP